DLWDIRNPAHINGGVNHFGSPFNFPEEFITVYRLHPLVPDLIEYREWNNDANQIRSKVPVVETFRGKATEAMRSRGLANWALSMGRQRLGLLTLRNSPRFLQNLKMERLHTPTGQIDIAALDLIRDRERGVPRFNEFRRQYGLRQMTSFDDYVDKTLPAGSPDRKEQEDLAKTLRDVYGQHVCDAGKVITDAQLDENSKPITDCLGFPDRTLVDNVEDVDTVVGFLAEPRRPHGFAISETQFVVFILNASRRLFSDRFFTSSFRPEFYTTFGLNWVNNNGPVAMMETAKGTNGHEQPVSPLKRILLRTMPELEPELKYVVNAFDPWARDRGEYYSLAWKPRPGAESDEAFRH
ncbi:MAG TPA: peroxidase family protein, partial [Acidobacteriota bacterium]|nr:peroxidase family protein [Acidobacteriota bacterium]